MLPIRNRLRTTLNLSDQQITTVIKLGLSLLWTVVLPTIVLCSLLALTLQDYYLTAFVVVVVVNLFIRYHKQVRQAVKARKKHRDNMKRASVDRKHDNMFHTINPSVFTYSWSGLGDEKLRDKTYVDDTQHWLVAVRLFFNPFAEHGEKIPEGRTAAGIYRFFRTLAEYTWTVWVAGWLVMLGLVVVDVFSDHLPQLAAYMPGTLFSTTVLGTIMVAWTIVWTWYITWLFPRDRFTVTTESYVVTSRRLPFQDIENRKGEIKDFQSVVLKTTLLGFLLGYSHIEIQSWQEPEPIPGRRFVKQAERVKVVLERLADQSRDKTQRPPGHSQEAAYDELDVTTETSSVNMPS